MMAAGMVALLGAYLLLDKYMLPMLRARLPQVGFRPRTDP